MQAVTYIVKKENIYIHIHICTFAFRPKVNQHQMSSSTMLHLIFERDRVSYWIWCLLIWLRRLVSELQGNLLTLPARFWVLQTYTFMPGFYMGPGDLNLDLYTSTQALYWAISQAPEIKNFNKAQQILRVEFLSGTQKAPSKTGWYTCHPNTQEVR